MNFDWVKCLKPARDWGPRDPVLYVDYIRSYHQLAKHLTQDRLQREPAVFSSGPRLEPQVPSSIRKDVLTQDRPRRTDAATEVSVVTNTGPAKDDRAAKNENEDPKA
ncbi:hypothetical protein MRX96_014064 [Rhipicephalus microplus]